MIWILLGMLTLCGVGILSAPREPKKVWSTRHTMSQFKVMTMLEIEREAENKSCTVVVALPNQLQFDLDTPEAMSLFESFCTRLAIRYGYFLPREEWNSRSGKGKHVVLTLPTEMSVPERIALQVMGGSDVGREFSALCCHWDGSTHPLLLFSPIMWWNRLLGTGK